MPGVSAGGHGHHGQGKHASDSESILRAASGATSHQTKPVLEEHPFDEEDFQEMLTETFKEFANEDEDLVEKDQLKSILDVLVEDELIAPFDDAELDQLMNDMDAFETGKIPLVEYLDVLTRRAKGVDFTDEEIEEAFKCFKIEEDKDSFGAKELRQVMAAVCDVQIKSHDADNMIAGAADSAGQKTISFDEFKNILSWKETIPDTSSVARPLSDGISVQSPAVATREHA